MLYNVEKGKANKTGYCITCPHFDRVKKECKGIGKNCFEYDPKTKTIFDPLTRLPIKAKLPITEN